MSRAVLIAPILAGVCWIAGCAAGPPGEPVPETDAGWLVDVTAGSGLSFTHASGARGNLHLPEIIGSGAALFDADGDGDLDAYLVSGSFALEGRGAEGGPVNRLFLQQPDGTFRDATVESGLGDAGYGIGVAIGDVDNDGDADVYLTNHGPDRLYRNLGDGRFEEITAAAGINVGGFSCSAVFCDYDVDGYLDLYVTQYVRYDPEQYCRNASGQRDYCSPKAYNPAPDVLLHNDGDGTFTEVGREAGLHGAIGAGLGVACEDFDRDGLPDFYAANDQYANHLWINQGDGRFRERALLLGAAYNLEGRAEAGMGVAAADLDRDLDLDLFVTHIGGQSNTLYANLGEGLFEDATGASGLAQSSLPFTGFGTAAFDVELDGDLDLFVANGRVFRGETHARAIPAEPWSHFAEPNLFYSNRGGGRFRLERTLAGAFTGPVEVSRALATGDVDGDGDVDLLLTNTEAPARLYRNEAPRAGNWLIVRAVEPALRRDAIGARLTLHAGSLRLLRTISNGFGFLSSSDPRAHFGLGGSETVERIDVRWPDGHRESFPVGAANRTILLERGKGRPAA